MIVMMIVLIVVVGTIDLVRMLTMVLVKELTIGGDDDGAYNGV